MFNRGNITTIGGRSSRTFPALKRIALINQRLPNLVGSPTANTLIFFPYISEITACCCSHFKLIPQKFYLTNPSKNVSPTRYNFRESPGSCAKVVSCFNLTGERRNGIFHFSGTGNSYSLSPILPRSLFHLHNFAVPLRGKKVRGGRRYLVLPSNS